MFENLSLNTETILILGIVTFVAFALLGLVVWNSKTNKQVKTLISIDDSLKHMEAAPSATQEEAIQTPAEPVESQQPQNAESVEVAEEIQTPESKANVGRSGRVYTKEELEVQIR
jgi:hypothetical protein